MASLKPSHPFGAGDLVVFELAMQTGGNDGTWVILARGNPWHKAQKASNVRHGARS